MATRTSSQNGNWSSPSTWGGSAAPGSGDRAIIAHSVTVDTTTTVGESLNALISGTGTVGTGGASSATLTGSGTAFDTELKVGDYIKIGSSERIVTAIASATSLTMNAVATIANGTAFTYTPTAIYLSGTSARLIVNDNLTVKGGLMTHYPSSTPVNIVTVADQKGIEFDASGSPGTTATKYPIGFIGAGNQYCTWKFNGTACSIAAGATDGSFLRSNAGGGNAFITLMGTVVGGWLDAAYTRFTRIGDATNPAYPYYLGNTSDAKLILNRCVVDNCGVMSSTTNPANGSALRVTGTRFTNSLDATYSFKCPSNYGGATVVIEKAADGTYCYFDKVLKVNVDFVNSLGGFVCGMKPEFSGFARWGGLNDTWIRQESDSWSFFGDLTNSVMYYDKPSGTNPHFISTSGGWSPSTEFTVSGNAFYFNGSDAGGNIITHSGSGSTDVAWRIRNNLFLPNGAGLASGVALTSSGDLTDNYKIRFYHNTGWIDGQWGLEIGHFQTVVESPNRWGDLHSNLWIGGSQSDRYIAANVDDSALVDIIPPGVISKNARYLVKPIDTGNAATFTNQGNGYAAKFSTTPGTTDIDLDASGGPNFVGAPTGTPATSFLSQWSTSLGGAGTDDDAWANVAAGTAGYTPAAFLAFLATKCAPTNSLLKDAGEDGVTIGAMEGVFSTGKRMDHRYLCPR